MSVQLVEKYNDIASIKQKLLAKISTISDEKFNELPSNGGWSLGQTYYHVYFSEYGTIKTIQKNLRENKVMNDTKIGDVFRNIFLVIMLKLPIKFKAPKVVSKVPDTISKKEIEEMFAKNSEEFKSILNDLPNDLENKQIFKHPIAGLFNINQCMNFVREHYMHHERQIDALL